MSESTLPLNSFDSWADNAFDRIRNRSLPDRLFYGVTEAANHSLLWHAIAWLRGFASPAGRRRAARISLILMAESVVVNGPIKSLFRRPRPVPVGPRPHRLRIPQTTSFPSGHATSALCAAALLSKDSRIAPAYYGLACVVASSRVYVRIHHASDIVVGAAIGAAVGAFTRRLLDRPR